MSLPRVVFMHLFNRFMLLSGVGYHRAYAIVTPYSNITVAGVESRHWTLFTIGSVPSKSLVRLSCPALK